MTKWDPHKWDTTCCSKDHGCFGLVTSSTTIKPFYTSGCGDFPLRSKCFRLKLFLASMQSATNDRTPSRMVEPQIELLRKPYQVCSLFSFQILVSLVEEIVLVFGKILESITCPCAASSHVFSMFPEVKMVSFVLLQMSPSEEPLGTITFVVPLKISSYLIDLFNHNPIRCSSFSSEHCDRKVINPR